MAAVKDPYKILGVDIAGQVEAVGSGVTQFKPGDEVLTTTQDYPRMLTTLRQRERRDRIRLKLVKIPVPPKDPAEITAAYEAGFTPRTRLVPIVFLTAKDETADRVEGFRAGVDAYLTKPFEPEELVAVVASILDRVQRTHSDLARMFGEQEADDYELIRDEDLTDAEWRVAEAVARGLSNKEIAAELNLSLRTVEGHISRILDKKNLSNRVELALHVRERKQPD